MNTPIPKGDASARRDRGDDDGARAFNLQRRDWFAQVRAGIGIGKAWATTAVAHVVAFDVLRAPGYVSHMSTAQIADVLDTSRQVVERAIDALEAAGYLRVLRGQGRGKAHTYELVVPAKAEGPGDRDEGNLPVASVGPEKRNSSVAFSGTGKGNRSVASRGPKKGNPSVASPDPEPGRADEEKATQRLREKATGQLQEKATGELPQYKGTEVNKDRPSQEGLSTFNSDTIHTPVEGAREEITDPSPVAAGSAEAHEAPLPPENDVDEDDLLNRWMPALLKWFPSVDLTDPILERSFIRAASRADDPSHILIGASNHVDDGRDPAMTSAALALWLDGSRWRNFPAAMLTEGGGDA